MARLMTASYEKLLEEFYAPDRATRLQHILESDVREILNDATMRNLLKEFLVRLDRDSNFRPKSETAVKYFEVLARLNSFLDFQCEQDELTSLCFDDSDLKAVVDDSSLKVFLESQKIKCYRAVESHEYEKFKEYLKKKFQTRRRRR